MLGFVDETSGVHINLKREKTVHSKYMYKSCFIYAIVTLSMQNPVLMPQQLPLSICSAPQPSS